MSAKTSLATMWPYRMADDNDDREATELNEQQSPPPAQRFNPDGVESAVDGRARVQPLHKEQHVLRKFWKRQIAVTVDHEDCRDHFGRFLVCSYIASVLRPGVMVELLYYWSVLYELHFVC